MYVLLFPATYDTEHHLTSGVRVPMRKAGLAAGGGRGGDLRTFAGRSLAVLALAILAIAAGFIATSSNSSRTTATVTPGIIDLYKGAPLGFERNDGQTDARVKFLSRGDGYMLFLTPSAAVLSMRARSKNAAEVLRMEMVGANSRAKIEGDDRLPGKSNYFIGNDPTKWHDNIPSYSKVWYRGVYPGVDLAFYGANQRQLEYDFVLAPGADPNAIGVRFEGAKNLALDQQGDLIIQLADGGKVIHHAPAIYQEIGGTRETVNGKCVLRGGSAVGFELASYDHSRAVYIDPGLTYSTYLGGNKTDAATGIAVESSDSSGFAYVTGSATSTDFPTSAGAFQTKNNSTAAITPTNAFVTKLNADGSGLVYSTYLGGSGSDSASGIAVDSSGDAYVAGTAGSTDFPTTIGAYQTKTNSTASFGSNAFVTKLAADGSSLVYSTYLGGSGRDSATGIAIDSLDFAYVTGSAGSTDFPTTKGAFQTTNNATESQDNAFITKLNTGGTGLVYSTYLGGSASDNSVAIAVDSMGFAYVTGTADSNNFPTTSGAFQTTDPTTSYTQSFVTKLKTDGSALVYSTYLGGTTGYDVSDAIAVDSGGYAYVAGGANASDFPTTAGAFQTANNTTYLAGTNAFVTKFKTDGSGLVYSTYVGGSFIDLAQSIAVDSSGYAYITGSSYSSDYPTTACAFQPGNASGANMGANGFVTKLATDGSSLINSTYLGGTTKETEHPEDYGAGIALDSSDFTYVTGGAASANFPTTAGAFQGTNHSTLSGPQASNAFVTKLSLAPVSVCSTATPTSTSGTPTPSGTPAPSGTPTSSSGSPTPSATPTSSSSKTPTPTASPTGTPSPTATATAECTATPVPGKIRIKSKHANFGSVEVGGMKEKTLTISNAGKVSKKKHPGTITIIGESSNNPAFTVKEACTCQQLTPRMKHVKAGSCGVEILFAPSEPMKYSGTLMITDNLSPSGMQTVKLRGSGKAGKK
jgi:hypothetical protein